MWYTHFIVADLVDKLFLFELAGSFSSQSCFAACATFFHPLMFLDFSFSVYEIFTLSCVLLIPPPVYVSFNASIG